MPMNIKIFLILIVITVSYFSCKNKDNKSPEVNFKKDQFIEVKAYDKALLKGVWAENTNDNAFFYIENDSIYYVEHQDSPLAIDLIDNQLVIYFEGFVAKNDILKLTTDSLIYEVDHEVIKLYNRKH
jgi:hypothetical protein